MFHNFFCFRCPPEDLGFPPFTTGSVSGPGSLASMSYLKSSPYIMAVDSFHSMGYPSAGKQTNKQNQINRD